MINLRTSKNYFGQYCIKNLLHIILLINFLTYKGPFASLWVISYDNLKRSNLDQDSKWANDPSESMFWNNILKKWINGSKWNEYLRYWNVIFLTSFVPVAIRQGLHFVPRRLFRDLLLQILIFHFLRYQNCSFHRNHQIFLYHFHCQN